MFSHVVQYSDRVAFGIDLMKNTIFLAPEFYLCGKCKCVKNRGEIYNHLEECFTSIANKNTKNICSRSMNKFIRDRISFVLAILEFALSNCFSLLLLFFL